ncbi:metalloregulator ArsR/SmtB family transcription factor [Thermoactinomyces sp. DSM 45892]|uniref:ArsR/SmtB family transcription factor n=1 Tax=Thermoactinomyces sp. DSM 45892 TaxID=1882753 RepID=UPI0008999F3A|nr:metalloregulator ArsR/SmtB family transcription factor [Thermoactinomyces sp. DSM 45892]SDY58682.1 cadmium-sensing regulator, CadC [Thermoactinomyces sp. DSM 45892]
MNPSSLRSEEQCEVICVDESKVTRIQQDLQTEDFEGTAQLFKALADPTRLKIAYAIHQEGELCVCDIAEIISSSIATASHHLRLLKKMGLAKIRKEGKLVYYSLDDDHVSQLIQLAFVHQKEVR